MMIIIVLLSLACTVLLYYNYRLINEVETMKYNLIRANKAVSEAVKQGYKVY